MKNCIYFSLCFKSKTWHCPHCGFVPAQYDNYVSFVCEEGIAADIFNPKIFAAYAAADALHFWASARSSLIIFIVGLTYRINYFRTFA